MHEVAASSVVSESLGLLTSLRIGEIVGELLGCQATTLVTRPQKPLLTTAFFVDPHFFVRKIDGPCWFSFELTRMLLHFWERGGGEG